MYKLRIIFYNELNISNIKNFNRQIKEIRSFKVKLKRFYFRHFKRFGVKMYTSSVVTQPFKAFILSISDKKKKSLKYLLSKKKRNTLLSRIIDLRECLRCSI